MTSTEAKTFFEKVEAEHKEKAKELKTFLQVCGCGDGGTRMNRIAFIGRTTIGTPIAEKELNDATNNIFRQLVLGTTTLKNGKNKGEWNNGSFGSRWWDWTNGKLFCRIAFHSKRFSTEWEHPEAYALLLTFEKA